MKKISVIVPVYNSEAYIEKCVNSLLKQTYKNIEIIMIDDASDDSSVEIMREYEKEYKGYIKCFYLKEPLCAGGARNIGIKNAAGEYITFVDSDDYIKENMLEVMYNKVEKSGADECNFNCNMIDSLTQNPILHNRFYEEAMGKLDFCKRRINILLNTSVCWGILIKKSILLENKIYFPEKNMCEDYVWKCVFWIYVDFVEMVKEGLYIHIRHTDSLSHVENRRNDFEKSVQWLREWYNSKKWTKEEHKLFLYGILKCLNMILLYHNSILEKVNKDKYINLIKEIKSIYSYLKYDIGIYLNDTILMGKNNNKNNYKYIKNLYYDEYNLFKTGINNLINKYKNNGYSIFIFGGGRKGTAFLEVIDSNKCKVDGIIDSDYLKWGRKIITGHIIYNIQVLKEKRAVVFIINRDYYTFVENEIANFENKDVKLVNLEIELCKIYY